MKKIICSLLKVGVVGIATLAASPAHALWTIDFDTKSDGTSISGTNDRADKITTQYSAGTLTIPGSSAKVTFSGFDGEGWGSNFDVPIAFDTTDPLNTTGTGACPTGENGCDPDLASPFSDAGVFGGPGDNTVANLEPGNILVIPEGGNGQTNCSNPSFCTQPDDDVGQVIIADFLNPDGTDGIGVTLVSIDLYDVTDPANGQSVTIELFAADDSASLGTFTPTIGGNNKALRLFFGGATGVSGVGKLVATFQGSGGLDNIRGDVGVPEPATLMLLSLGVVGLACSARRRRTHSRA